MNIKIAIKYDKNEIANVAKLVRHLFVLSSVEDQSALNQVELAIVELLTNIIRHSKEVPVDGLIELNCRQAAARFTVTVSDRGQALSSDVASEYANDSVIMPSLDLGIDELPESGWGIQLIKSACDQVSYKRSNEKNIYKLSFDLSLEAV